MYTDFSKAFEKINHSILVQRLAACGVVIPLLDLLHSYLSECTQQVKVGDHHLYSADISSGVLQGSILGPLLFWLYINDVGLNFTSRYCLFFDDLKIYRAVGCSGDIVSFWNDLLALERWCPENDMPISFRLQNKWLPCGNKNFR